VPGIEVSFDPLLLLQQLSYCIAPIIVIIFLNLLIDFKGKNMPTKQTTPESTRYVEPSKPEPEPNYTKYAVIGSLIVVLLITLLSSVYTVSAGEVGIITHWGAVKKTVQPGIGFKTPIAEGIVKMTIRTQKDQVDAAAASKDLQLVTSTIAVNYHLDGKYAIDIYKNVGTNYADILIAPAIQNTFKGITAQFTAEELITKREEVRIKAEAALAEQLNTYHIVVENFNIVNFDFSQEFNAAIEAKQVAQQQVETAKQKLAQAKVDAETAVTTAQGQADAQAALKDTGALTPEYLQYLALTKWDGHLPQVTGGVTPFVDVNDLTNTPTVYTTK
jgi:regulator of protease activity HflC (stomatin/prohibitin superfamily)